MVCVFNPWSPDIHLQILQSIGMEGVSWDGGEGGGGLQPPPLL